MLHVSSSRVFRELVEQGAHHGGAGAIGVQEQGVEVGQQRVTAGEGREGALAVCDYGGGQIEGWVVGWGGSGRLKCQASPCSLQTARHSINNHSTPPAGAPLRTASPMREVFSCPSSHPQQHNKSSPTTARTARPAASAPLADSIPDAGGVFLPKQPGLPPLGLKVGVAPHEGIEGSQLVPAH